MHFINFCEPKECGRLQGKNPSILHFLVLLSSQRDAGPDQATGNEPRLLGPPRDGLRQRVRPHLARGLHSARGVPR